MNKDDLISTIQSQHDKHIDYHDVTLKDNMAYDSSWKWNNKTASIVKSAEGQLLTSLGVPSSFFNKCKNVLRKSIYDDFVKPKKTYLVRASINEEGADPTIRAILSSRYAIHDNIDIFPVAIEELDQYNISYVSYRLDNKVSQLVVRFEDTAVVHEGQTYYAGVSITNSETGFSAIWVEPVVLTPYYTIQNRRNLLKQGADIRTTHRGEFNADRIREQVQLVRDIGQLGVVQFIEAKTETISAAKALSFVKSRDTIPSRFQNILEEEWAFKDDIVKADAYKRILELASGLPLFQQSQVNQDVGEWSGVFSDYKNRMESIALEVAEFNND